MRLWHKDLINVLPRQQLLAQWRECCCIARNTAVNGTPNHILVNKMLDYSLSHFVSYTDLITEEMKRRGYAVSNASKVKYSENIIRIMNYNHMSAKGGPIHKIDYVSIFRCWHDERYFIQCYHNMEEKYDCGGIPDNEWEKVIKRGIGIIW